VGVSVRAPDGREWAIRRRWLRRPKWRDFDAWSNAPYEQAFVIDELPGLLIALVGLLLLGLVIAFLLPLIVFVVEAVLLAAAAYILGRTWVIEAETNGPPAERRAWHVRGWRRSRRAVDEVVRELRAGVEAEPRDGELLA
jgi:hypothetical protein